jgi:hypothetical protein
MMNDRSFATEQMRRFFRSGMTEKRWVCRDCGKFYRTDSGAERHRMGARHTVIEGKYLQEGDLVGRSFRGAGI